MMTSPPTRRSRPPWQIPLYSRSRVGAELENTRRSTPKRNVCTSPRSSKMLQPKLRLRFFFFFYVKPVVTTTPIKSLLKCHNDCTLCVDADVGMKLIYNRRGPKSYFKSRKFSKQKETRWDIPRLSERRMCFVCNCSRWNLKSVHPFTCVKWNGARRFSSLLTFHIVLLYARGLSSGLVVRIDT